jgi:hypothetical protein
MIFADQGEQGHGQVLAIAAGLFLVVGWYYIASTIRSWYRLRHIPGPRLASLSYLWLTRVLWKGRQYETYKTIHDEYGSSLVRVGPNELMTDDPEVARRTGSVKKGTHNYPRAKWYDAMRMNVDHAAMFNLLDPHVHDRMKAKLAPGYSGRETPGVESIVDEQLGNLVQLIRSKYLHGKKSGNHNGGGEFLPLDLVRVIPLFTLDVISRIVLGEEFGCVKADKDVFDFYHNIEMAAPAMGVISEVPWVRDIVYSRLGLGLIMPKETDATGLGKLMG